jgi:hypothetical protein
MARSTHKEHLFSDSLLPCMREAWGDRGQEAVSGPIPLGFFSTGASLP